MKNVFLSFVEEKHIKKHYYKYFCMYYAKVYF